MKTYLIIDKFTISRETLCSLIRQTNNNSTVYQANTIENAKSVIAQKSQIDFLIFNPTYMKLDSYEYMHRLNRISPQAKVLIISTSREPGHLQSLKENGADATVTINSSMDEIIAAIRLLETANHDSQQTCVNYKEVQSDIRLSAVVADNQEKTADRNFKLTNRQKEVLDYVTKGYANKLIAYELGVSEGTIKLHVSSILRALKVTNRTEAAMRAGQFLQSHAL